MISLLASQRIMTKDIATQEDFADPLLKNIFLRLSEGASPATLVEEMATEQDRARASRLLMAPPAEDTDQLLVMAKQCLDTMRRRRITDRMKQLTESIGTLPAAQKQAALNEYQELNRRLQRLKPSSHSPGS